MKISKLWFLPALLLISFGARLAILGDAKEIRLSPAAPLAGEISQGLGATSSARVLPDVGSDFSINSVHYLDNSSWAVASLSLAGSGNPGNDFSYIVMHKVNGVFTIVLGPGTAFPQNQVDDLPSDVATYLGTQEVVIYEPAD